MTQVNGICGKTLASGSIALMARIVDSAGAGIRPSDVLAIEYSAYEIDPYWPEQLTVVRGHRAVPLAVPHVLFDWVQVGDGWGVDDMGYNFRHEIRFAGDEPLQGAGPRFEVAYQLTFVGGRRTSVRFKLRCSALDNPLPGPPPKGEGVEGIEHQASGENHDRH
jgi:hypothetical protein